MFAHVDFVGFGCPPVPWDVPVFVPWGAIDLMSVIGSLPKGYWQMKLYEVEYMPSKALAVK